MRRVLYLTFLCGLIFSACSKSRTCECKNTNNTYDAGETDATRHQAKKYCKELSSGDTECHLKK